MVLIAESEIFNAKSILDIDFLSLFKWLSKSKNFPSLYIITSHKGLNTRRVVVLRDHHAAEGAFRVLLRTKSMNVASDPVNDGVAGLPYL